jgi:hypothetical protein
MPHRMFKIDTDTKREQFIPSEEDEARLYSLWILLDDIGPECPNRYRREKLKREQSRIWRRACGRDAIYNVTKDPSPKARIKAHQVEEYKRQKDIIRIFEALETGDISKL